MIWHGMAVCWTNNFFFIGWISYIPFPSLLLFLSSFSSFNFNSKIPHAVVIHRNTTYLPTLSHKITFHFPPFPLSIKVPDSELRPLETHRPTAPKVRQSKASAQPATHVIKKATRRNSARTPARLAYLTQPHHPSKHASSRPSPQYTPPLPQPNPSHPILSFQRVNPPHKHKPHKLQNHHIIHPFHAAPPLFLVRVHVARTGAVRGAGPGPGTGVGSPSSTPERGCVRLAPGEVCCVLSWARGGDLA